MTWHKMNEKPDKEGWYIIKHYKPFNGYKFSAVMWLEDTWMMWMARRGNHPRSKWRNISWTPIPGGQYDD